MIHAEVVKLVRRRGLMAWTAVLTVGVVVLAYAILLVLHAASPATHGPAGGAHSLENLMFLVGGLGSVAAMIVGTTAGSQDVSSGVFRDLSVTGRSGRELFSVRAPGALIVFAPFFLAAFGLAVAGSFAFASGLPTASAHTIGDYLAWTAAIQLVDLALAVGLTAFASSRVVVGVLLAWSAIAARALIRIDNLGRARQAIDVAAAEHFAPLHAVGPRVWMTGTTAVVVLAIWAAVPLAAGLWRTQRLDA